MKDSKTNLQALSPAALESFNDTPISRTTALVPQVHPWTFRSAPPRKYEKVNTLIKDLELLICWNHLLYNP